MSRRAIVRVIYKSGHFEHITCDSFSTKRRGSELTEVKWENAKPDPLFLGIGDIAAIYVIRTSR